MSEQVCSDIHYLHHICPLQSSSILLQISLPAAPLKHATKTELVHCATVFLQELKEHVNDPAAVALPEQLPPVH